MIFITISAIIVAGLLVWIIIAKTGKQPGPKEQIMRKEEIPNNNETTKYAFIVKQSDGYLKTIFVDKKKYDSYAEGDLL